MKKNIFLVMILCVLIVFAIYNKLYCTINIDSNNIDRIELLLGPQKQKELNTENKIIITDIKKINNIVLSCNKIICKYTKGQFEESPTDSIRIYYKNDTCCEIMYKKGYQSKGMICIQKIKFDNEDVNILNPGRFFYINNDDIEELFQQGVCQGDGSLDTLLASIIRAEQ